LLSVSGVPLDTLVRGLYIRFFYTITICCIKITTLTIFKVIILISFNH
jgi:hypothetical protein